MWEARVNRGRLKAAVIFGAILFLCAANQSAECGEIPAGVIPANKNNSPKQKQVCNDAGCFVQFRGAWFDIMYPAEFSPKIIQKSALGADKADAVIFSSPDKLVEFYIYSPQWDGVAPGIEISPTTERLDSEKSSKSKDGIITWFTISSRKGEYIRSYQEFKSDSVHWVIGIKYKDKNNYDNYKKQYLFFKKSLRQYAD
jgi:hypothetical protein